MPKSKLNILLTGGTGFIGKHLVTALTKSEHTVTILSRSDRSSKDPYVTYKKWNGKEMPAGMGIYDVVINLAGSSIAEGRWTSTRKEEILESRLQATACCVNFINASPKPPKLFISGSAVGYYGVKNHDEIDEKGKAGDDFAARVCKEWEAEAQKAKCRTVLPRIGIVLGKEGGALKKMIPIYQFYLGAVLGSGKQGFPWIHIEDLVQIFLFFIEQTQIEGPVNVVSPQVTDQKTFSHKLADALHKIDFFTAPKFVLDLLMGEQALLLWGGQKAIPRLLQKEQFTFRFSELDQALKDLV